MSHTSTFRRDLYEWLRSPFVGRARGKYTGSIIVNNVDVRPYTRESADIKKWKRAMVEAGGPNQDRFRLYELYAECMLDGVLKRAVSTRTQAVTNCAFTFTVDGEPVPEIEALLRRSYFRDLLRGIMMSRFYGHSLVEMGWPANGAPDRSGWTAEIDRRYVRPRHGIVVKNRADTTGFAFREPPFSATVLEAGHHEDLGDILEACQYAVYKAGGFGDWAEFAEVFGMPFRWGKYDSEATRQTLEASLSTAGAAGYVVAPTDAQIETVHGNPSGTGGEVFRQLVDACNREIQISIEGQTMTATEAKNSGYAQATVHQKTKDELKLDDRAYVLQYLNERLVDYLILLGYPADGGEFAIPDREHLSLAQRIDVDLKLSGIIPIAQSHFYTTYHVPRPTANDPPVGQWIDEEGDEPTKAAGDGEEE